MQKLLFSYKKVLFGSAIEKNCGTHRVSLSMVLKEKEENVNIKPRNVTTVTVLGTVTSSEGRHVKRREGGAGKF